MAYVFNQSMYIYIWTNHLMSCLLLFWECAYPDLPKKSPSKRLSKGLYTYSAICRYNFLSIFVHFFKSVFFKRLSCKETLSRQGRMSMYKKKETFIFFASDSIFQIFVWEKTTFSQSGHRLWKRPYTAAGMMETLIHLFVKKTKKQKQVSCLFCVSKPTI